MNYLVLLGILLLSLSLLFFVISFGGLVLLWLKGIKITGPNKSNIVTFWDVAPEFAKALEVLREEKSQIRSELSQANMENMPQPKDERIALDSTSRIMHQKPPIGG